jgi:prepilin-type N-terminal cleavage/methylation domain-containing protein
MTARAFTLVEVCLVMAILAAVAGFGLAANMGAYRNSLLRGEAGFVANLLRRARG